MGCSVLMRPVRPRALWIVRLSGISGRAGLMLDMTRLTHCGSRLCIAAGETLWFPGVQPPEAHGLVNLPSAVG